MTYYNTKRPRPKLAHFIFRIFFRMRLINYIFLISLCLAHPLAAQNRVLDLDGEQSYVQLPGHIFDDLEEATVEAWVKWDSWDYFSQWFAFGSDAGETGEAEWRVMAINHWYNSSTLQFFIYAPGNKPLNLLSTGSNLS